MDPADTDRVANMDSIFHLTEFWGKRLNVNSEIRSIIQEVQTSLEMRGTPLTDASVRKELQILATNAKKSIGKRGLSMRSEALYRYVENSTALRSEIVATA